MILSFTRHSSLFSDQNVTCWIAMKACGLGKDGDCNYPHILIPGYRVLNCPNTRVSGTGNGYPITAWLLIKWSTANTYSAFCISNYHTVVFTVCIQPNCTYFLSRHHFVTPRKVGLENFWLHLLSGHIKKMLEWDFSCNFPLKSSPKTTKPRFFHDTRVPIHNTRVLGTKSIPGYQVPRYG